MPIILKRAYIWSIDISVLDIRSDALHFHLLAHGYLIVEVGNVFTVLETLDVIFRVLLKTLVTCDLIVI